MNNNKTLLALIHDDWDNDRFHLLLDSPDDPVADYGDEEEFIQVPEDKAAWVVNIQAEFEKVQAYLGQLYVDQKTKPSEGGVRMILTADPNGEWEVDVTGVGSSRFSLVRVERAE